MAGMKKIKPSATKVLECKNCKANEYQDTLYGKGYRVHNQKSRPQDGEQSRHEYVCTVCGATQWA